MSSMAQRPRLADRGVIVKLAAGRSEARKKKLADEITHAVMSSVEAGSDSISVAIEDVPMSEWTERVCNPETLPQLDRLYKRRAYVSLR
jgi:4-oxalocrotonate tautomerase